MTAPKVGDHVRCKLGDSVLVGTIGDLGAVPDLAIKLDDCDERRYVNTRRWSIEVLPPPIPEWLTVPGARAFTDTAVMMRMRGTHENGDGPWRVFKGPWASHDWMSDAEVAALDPQPIPPAEKP